VERRVALGVLPNHRGFFHSLQDIPCIGTMEYRKLARMVP
jgi:hypothetical protein